MQSSSPVGEALMLSRCIETCLVRETCNKSGILVSVELGKGQKLRTGHGRSMHELRNSRPLRKNQRSFSPTPDEIADMAVAIVNYVSTYGSDRTANSSGTQGRLASGIIHRL